MPNWEDLPLLSGAVAQSGVYDPAANPVGDDPETYLDSPIDPDAAATESARMPYIDYVVSGVHNGDFTMGPPDESAPIDDENPLPFWQAALPTGGGDITIDTSSYVFTGRSVRLRLSDPSTNDEVSLIQWAPIASKPYTDLVRIDVQWAGVVEDVSGQVFVRYSTYAFDGSAIVSEGTATADVADGSLTTSWLRPHSHLNVIHPYYVRLQVGLKALASGAGTISASVYSVSLNKPPDSLAVASGAFGAEDQPALFIGKNSGGTAALQFGAGGTATADVAITRIAAGDLRHAALTDATATLRIVGGGTTRQGRLALQDSDDSQGALFLAGGNSAAQIEFGTGSAATDQRLSRASADKTVLARTDGTGGLALSVVAGDASSQASLWLSDSNDTVAQLALNGGNGIANIALGPGGGSSADVVLSRSAADTLFLAAGDTFSASALDARGTLTFSNVVSMDITADQNDWNPTGFASASILRANPTAARQITGITAGADGRMIWLYNRSTTGANTITLVNNSGSSGAGNRFATPGGVNYVIGDRRGACLWYDATSAFWRVMEPA